MVMVSVQETKDGVARLSWPASLIEGFSIDKIHVVVSIASTVLDGATNLPFSAQGLRDPPEHAGST